jgi:hypothetical protein
MKKTIVAITAAAFLGSTAVTLTATPAAAVYPIFLALAKKNENFKPVNPYDKKVVKRGKGKKR